MVEFCLNARELEVLEYIVLNAPVLLRDVEKYVMEQFGVGLRAAALVLQRLREKGIIKYSRDYKKRYTVDVSPDFISFISKWYNLLYRSPSRDRLRYFDRKHR